MNNDWIYHAPAPLDREAMAAAEARQGQLTKPSGSLGRLERLAVTLAGLQGSERPAMERVAITVFAADHGVAAEGISAFPQEVTTAMIANFANGGAAISVLAAELGASLEVVNAGALTAAPALPGVLDRRIAAGTANFCEQPAMDEAQLLQALALGREAVERAYTDGAQLFIGGEMGIGNTTPATALAAAMLGKPPAELAGPGTGLNAEGVAYKAQVIARAIELHREALDKPLELLRRLGGFEIAALCGAAIAAAQRGLPLLVDGYISSVAALVALRINPEIAPWLLLSHASAEPGHAAVVAAIGGQPLLDLQMRLGEGSGAAVTVPLLRLACALHNNMATFAEAGVASGA
ncbi:MAG: nicotinate-nucleotide--dimethylbenzimidazole phosphoribosyltransferase [Gammaproteobacteria bacterium]|nr:nicotinate-nucleotide--dimethylbenzimidazole phosphoribosyltransferase [Gammaproteobacteria bacterium]MCW8841462.1 nicotinate-nucleotide--dimethylbenzimidazole phosphoribosyltransferase [Gammaproteobacteria bacterium]MCW8927882.1 nicotinate-nucleotide--dimethylbenzimidazole phosphoribosyltransferase [Gammaproteobacteria bacterium]MCW8958139.1 nicotinate-nucleotide--dimethylbenzimidazole phosphoribosyltransferase [Gammaproteobacteria bacterium]MCW8973866.1 nicotinate-nucleotide--dimethylbenzi